MKSVVQPRKQQSSNPDVSNTTITVAKKRKLTFPVQYFNDLEKYNIINS